MARGYRDDEEDEALPWLEPAEPEDEEENGGFPYRGLIIVGAAVVALVAVLWFVADWIGGGRTADNVAAVDEIPLIQAPEGAYKVRPDNPGGLDVDADSLTHSVAEGQDPDSEIAIDVIPEEPVPVIPAAPVQSAPVPEPGTAARVTVPPPAQKVLPAEKVPPKVAEKVLPKPVEKPVAKAPVKETPKPVQKVETPKPATKEAPKPEPAKPAPVKVVAAKPEPAKASGSVTVQLGAFNSTASADQVWSKLSGRVGALGGLRKSVQPVESGGKTLYRLRAGGSASEAQAGSVCAAVQAAGEQCVIVR